METKSSTKKADMETTITISELLVIGPGELGARVATLWKSKFPNAQITLKAHRNNPEREEYWKSLGFIPFKNDGNIRKYENVLFAAPPGSRGDGRTYANAVENAVENFVLPNGTFVFTSSGGVFKENSGKMVDENSDVVVLDQIIADGNSTNSTGRAKDPTWSLGRAQGTVYLSGQ